MQLLSSAVAGTLESSDVQVTIEPGNSGIELTIESSVLSQFGRQIKQVVLDTLAMLEISTAKITLYDNGALDTIIRARIVTAAFRSAELKENLPWGELS